RQTQTRTPRTRRRGLRVEALEDRTVPSTIQGAVFDDANANGVFDPGESALAGWTVWLDVNANHVLDPGEPAQATDGNGYYSFDTTNIPPAMTLSDGTQYDFVLLDLQVGSGGRWVNTNS